MSDFKKQYLDWYKNMTAVTECDTGWTAISIPLLDCHNDSLTVYAKEEDGKIMLSDDGYLINDLIDCGHDVDSKRLKRLIRSRGFELDGSGSEISGVAETKYFPLILQSFFQTMLEIIAMSQKKVDC